MCVQVTVAGSAQIMAGCINYNVTKQSKPCDAHPCLNDATCTDIDSKSYMCTCANHTYGTHCEKSTYVNIDIDVV